MTSILTTDVNVFSRPCDGLWISAFRLPLDFSRSRGEAEINPLAVRVRLRAPTFYSVQVSLLLGSTDAIYPPACVIVNFTLGDIIDISQVDTSYRQYMVGNTKGKYIDASQELHK